MWHVDKYKIRFKLVISHWTNEMSFSTHSRILFSSEYCYYKIFIHEKTIRKLKWQLPGQPLAARYNWCQSPVPGRGSAVEKHCLKFLVICTLKYGANYFLTVITEITQSAIHCVQCTAPNAGMTFCKFTNGRFILVYILLPIWRSFGPLLYSVGRSAVPDITVAG